MLEVFTNFINCLITAVLGFYIIKKITKSEIKITDIKVISLLTVQSLITSILQNNHSALHTIIIYFLNVIVYKSIFKININKSIVSVGISMFLIFISEIVISIIFIPIYTMSEIKNSWCISIFLNILISVIAVIMTRIPIIIKKIQKFYAGTSVNKKVSNTVFFLLIIITICFVAYDLYKNFNYTYEYFTNMINMIIVVALSIMFINSKNDYTKLSSEYDSLFSYIKNFEEWIEKEQLNRHEYKNQLAILRCLTKDKKLKNKIDEILEENINLEGDVIHELKNLPKGGLKGLMYYKTIVAQKNKIRLTFNVSIDKKTNVSKLSEKQMSTLCKLIGIYFDNAIEAARETRKKNVLIEVYDLKGQTNIVISNTFKNSTQFEKRNEKGVSTKGRDRGNGLHFANKLLSKNDWIEEKQEVVDDYYIQKLIIKKLEK